MPEATDYIILPPFKNEGYINVSDPEIQRKMKEAFEKIEKESKEYDIIVAGKRIKTDRKIRSINLATLKRLLESFQRRIKKLSIRLSKKRGRSLNTGKISRSKNGWSRSLEPPK